MTPEYIQMIAYVLFLACCFHHLKSKPSLYFLSSFVDTRIRSTNYVIIYFLMGMVYLRKNRGEFFEGIFQVIHAQKHKLLEYRKLVVLVDSCPSF